MKILPLLLLLAMSILPAEELPDFTIGGIIVLQDGFIALKIENSAGLDFALPDKSRDRVFVSLTINGVKRAEYKVKAVDPTIFLRNSFIVLKTNFRAGQPLHILVEVNGERALPESDFANNTLEKDLRSRF